MKKILYMLLCLLLFVGCTYQTGGNTGTSSTTTSNTDPVLTTTTPKPITATTTTTYNYPKPEYHDQIMAGNFSAITGEYIKSNGESIYLNKKGLPSEETTLGTINYQEGMYLSNVYSASGEGVGFYVFPIGKEIAFRYGSQYAVIDSDISKVRIAYGNAEINTSHIYTKKEE